MATVGFKGLTNVATLLLDTDRTDYVRIISLGSNKLLIMNNDKIIIVPYAFLSCSSQLHIQCKKQH